MSGQQFGSGLTTLPSGTSVTAYNQIAVPSAAQTVKQYFAVGNGANQDSYTVPAGKTLYIYTLYIVSTTATDVGILKDNAGTTILVEVMAGTGVPTPIISSVCPIATYTAGQIVKVWATDAAVYLGWTGVEVSA